MGAVEVPIQDSSVPTPWDSHFPDVDDGGPRTPLRPLILKWELRNHYVQFILHYLNDFLTASPPHSLVCQQNLESTLTLCQWINTPVKDEKVVPHYQDYILGIVIDTNKMTASISAERKSLMLEELQSFSTQKECTKRQLLSLVAKLSFACKVVIASCIFLRHLIDLSMTVEFPPPHLHIPRSSAGHHIVARFSSHLVWIISDPQDSLDN